MHSVRCSGSRYVCWDIVIFFFKQTTAYEMRISDWSSDVCSSDLLEPGPHAEAQQLFEVVAGLGEQVEPVDGVAVHVGHDQHALAAQVLDGHGGERKSAV